jgi:hypothetical protein
LILGVENRIRAGEVKRRRTYKDQKGFLKEK